MNHADSALSAFGQGLSCSQAVFSAYASEYGLDRDAAMKVSAGFGGGMGRMAQTCGAVTGAYMVIGLKYGAVSGQDQESKQMTYRLVREFAERFKAKNGSLVCKDLLGCDISTSDGCEEMKRKGLHGTVCVKAVRDACEILDEMLGREG
jgi:C_GCAxxG_C_C family probable redox protein